MTNRTKQKLMIAGAGILAYVIVWGSVMAGRAWGAETADSVAASYAEQLRVMYVALTPEKRSVVEESARLYYANIKSVRPSGAQVYEDDPEAVEVVKITFTCKVGVLNKVQKGDLRTAIGVANAQCDCVNSSLSKRKDLNGIALVCGWRNQAQPEEWKPRPWIRLQ